MSEDNKRKWEIEYEKLQNKGVDQEIRKLNSKLKRLQGKKIEGSTPQEYRKNKLEIEAQTNTTEKEIERLKTLKENLPKVERTVNFRNAQIKRLEKLNQEKKDYEASLKETKKLSEEAKELDEKLAKLKEQEEKINAALKDPKLSEENREKLELARSQNRGLQNKNQFEFSDKQLQLANKLKNPLPKKDFDKEIQATKNMISKSNFICRNLMEGKQMEDITVDLKNWKNSRFTDKTNKMKDVKENTKPEEVATKKEKTTSNKEKVTTEEDKEFEDIDKSVQEKIKEEDNRLMKVSEFDEKHPRLAKIKNFFRNTYESVKEKISKLRKKEDLVENNEPEKIEPDGKLSSEQIADRKAEFYKRLAETGKFSKTPNSSKMKESLAEQDKIAVGRKYQSKDDDSEER